MRTVSKRLWAALALSLCLYVSSDAAEYKRVEVSALDQAKFECTQQREALALKLKQGLKKPDPLGLRDDNDDDAIGAFGAVFKTRKFYKQCMAAKGWKK